jgi:hypothetical protein
MDKRWKIWSLACLGLALAALIALSAGLPGVEFQAGRPLRLPEPTADDANQAFASGAVGIILLVVRGVLALAVVAFPIYVVISLLTGAGRRRLLADVVALGLIVLFLSLLPRNPQSPEEKDALLPPVTESSDAGPEGPPDEFIAHVPPWLDALAAPAVAVFISGAAAAILWWVWRRPSPGPSDTLQHVAGQAQSALDALYAGEAFDDVIIRCYAQMSHILRQARSIEREKAMTPREFEQVLVQHGLPAGPVRDLTRLFERVRYGHQPAGEREERQAIASLEAIVAFCRGAGGAS